jgi:hypothetical protein
VKLEFFGQFLLRRGEIEAEQLRQALDLMEELNQPLGELAVAEGFATEADCRRVNDEQRRTDLPFGELAMQMGVLNSIELEEILHQQRETRVDLDAALVELGCLPEDRLQDLHDEWKSEQEVRPDPVVELPPALHGSPSADLVVGLLPRMLRRVADLEVKVGPGQALDRPPDRVLLASIDAVGTRPLRISLMVDPSFGERLARGLLGMQLDALAAELSLDAVGEFLNIMMGTVVATLEQQSHELRLEPPRYGILPTSGWSFPIVSQADGCAEMVLEILG